MTKDEFFTKNQLAGSLAILDLDENDDQSKWLYEALLSYRELPLEEFLLEREEFEGNEAEFIEYFIDELDLIITRAKAVKKFMKKRQKTL